MGKLMNGRELFVYPLSTLVAHQTGNRHRHSFNDLTVLDKNNAALLFLQSFDGKCHIFIICSYGNDIVRVMGNTYGNSPLFNAISGKKSVGNISQGMMPFRDTYLYNIHFRVSHKVSGRIKVYSGCCLLRNHAAGKNLNKVYLIALQLQLQLLLGEVGKVHTTFYSINRMLLQFRQVLTMLRAKLTLNPNLLHTEILKIIKKYNIRSITGSNGSSIFDSEAFTGINGGHPDGFHSINPGFHAHPKVIVQMSLM